MSPHARVATALRVLQNQRAEEEFFASVPVVSLDEWVVENAPEWIRELEERDGIPHWTTRQRAARQRLTASGLRRGRSIPITHSRKDADHG